MTRMTVATKDRNAEATQRLKAIVEENHQGKPVGIYSICSANRFVLEAGIMQARRDESLLLVESTSNQVNQFGGYTGQTPAEFVFFVRGIASAANFPTERIVLGGDHLGPLVWRKENSSSAMQKARDLVRACVLAGYAKIHLDASMPLANDPVGALSDEVVSGRAAELCEAAEEAHRELGAGAPAPMYVIGTEVPVPGGEPLDAQAPKVTRVEDLSRTIEVARRAFQERNLKNAWERVIAIVVQPGVEFGDEIVFPYVPRTARQISDFISQGWHGVYEAHSTDYQTPHALREMVRDHFAILKVGPWLTFAFREAVFALAAIEREWLGNREGIAISNIVEVLEGAMLADPQYWKNYYCGDETAQRIARKYSLSDRARYYWSKRDVADALERLLANLTAHPAPISLISQYLPNQNAALREGRIANLPGEMIRHKILEVIDNYAAACGLTAHSESREQESE
jgi:D-tagatose-1,6-bisphosphate aldolase subunit GatZ/KbaZ